MCESAPRNGGSYRARAYLRSTMLNAADHPPLPTRKVRVYHDGGFVATAAIAADEPPRLAPSLGPRDV